MPRKPNSALREKYAFSLYGINMEKVDNKYSIAHSTSVAEEPIPQNTTKIEDLTSKNNTEIVSFLDESKRVRKCTVSYIDYDKKIKYRCFWDRNPIPDNMHPIGCPIRFLPSKAYKSYNSEISKEKYVISEPVSETRADEVRERQDNRLYVENKGEYECDGIFCSFNCCLAYINAPENKHNPQYKNSERLLLQLYADINGKLISIKELIPAPHWRMLSEYGGSLSIQQFRDSFNKVEYLDHGVISSVSLGKLFESKIKF
jgi:hypothetical protein